MAEVMNKIFKLFSGHHKVDDVISTSSKQTNKNLLHRNKSEPFFL